MARSTILTTRAITVIVAVPYVLFLLAIFAGIILIKGILVKSNKTVL